MATFSVNSIARYRRNDGLSSQPDRWHFIQIMKRKYEKIISCITYKIAFLTFRHLAKWYGNLLADTRWTGSYGQIFSWLGSFSTFIEDIFYNPTFLLHLSLLFECLRYKLRRSEPVNSRQTFAWTLFDCCQHGCQHKAENAGNWGDWGLSACAHIQNTAGSLAASRNRPQLFERLRDRTIFGAKIRYSF